MPTQESSQSPADKSSESVPLVNARYAQFINIPHFYQDENVVVPELWAHDLAGQMPLISDFALASPRGINRPFENDCRKIPPVVPPQTFRLISLPAMNSFFRAFMALPRIFLQTWQLVSWAQVVHIGVAGWPICLGWLAGPLAKLRGRFLIVVIESPPCFLSAEQQKSWKYRLRKRFYEWMARRISRMSDLLVCTQSEYAKEYGDATTNCHISPASWINAKVICSLEEARASWQKKSVQSTPTVAYVGRLIEQKGIFPLMAAFDELELRGIAINLDIWGTGDLLARCQKWASQPRRHVNVQIRGSLPYDLTFFEQLREYTAVLVPSISDEQPRIIYDAFSQAVPIIGSATNGIKEWVNHMETGALVKPGDAASLADAIELCTNRLADVSRWGMQAWAESHKFTHSQMHSRRARIIKDCYESRGRDL